MNDPTGTSGRIRAALAVLIAALGASGLACSAADPPLARDATGAGGGASTSASATSGGAGACAYPTTGFANEVGGVIPESKKWIGFPEHATATSTISIGDFHDCDGARGVNALLIDESAIWCEACQEEAAELEGKLTGPWAALGIHVLTLMVDDAVQGSGATEATALTWKTKYALDAAAVGVDSSITFAPPNVSSIGLPLQILVDPRTMKIVEVLQGFSGDYASLEALAKKNEPAP